MAVDWRCLLPLLLFNVGDDGDDSDNDDCDDYGYHDCDYDDYI